MNYSWWVWDFCFFTILFVFICLGYFLSSSLNARPRDMQNSQTTLKLLIDSGLKFWIEMAYYLLMQCHTL